MTKKRLWRLCFNFDDYHFIYFCTQNTILNIKKRKAINSNKMFIFYELKIKEVVDEYKMLMKFKLMYFREIGHLRKIITEYYLDKVFRKN